MNGFEVQLTGSLLLAAAMMLWLGWTLLPAKIGAYFAPADLPAVAARLQLWIWLYRVHLFGHVVAVMGFIALATLYSGAAGRIVLWPGVGVLGAGILTAALASAFYYHFGAWGSITMASKDDADRREFVDSLRVSTEYVTCLVRFGRVFSGLGTIVLAIGLLLSATVLPAWLVISGAVLGLLSMGLTMGLPDNWSIHRPLFHLNALWLAAMGIVLLVAKL